MPPKKILKFKSKESLCHSFLEPILLLTHCQWLKVSYQISFNLPLNILDDFIHFSMIYLLHIAEAFQHMLCTQNKHQDAKVSVQIMSEKKQIFPNIYISYILWGEIFVPSIWVRNWHTFSFSPLFLLIPPIPPSFLLLSTTAPSTLPTPQWKWSQNIPPEMKEMRKACGNPD